jgi:hypothetical protein
MFLGVFPIPVTSQQCGTIFCMILILFIIAISIFIGYVLHRIIRHDMKI